MSQETLFDGQRLTMPQSIDLTVDSLLTHGLGKPRRYRRVAIAWSGGKDSTLLLVLFLHLCLTGQIEVPEEIVVLYADTRMELPPLAIAAAAIRAELDGIADDFARIGCALTVRVVLPPMDDRFFVYMFGRGVPPPSSQFRWCTERMKVKPMAWALEGLCMERAGIAGWPTDEPKRSDAEGQAVVAALRKELAERGPVDKILMLTGLRLGESAARDDRIHLACSKNDGECAQGWFQEALQGDLVDTLSPILPWRVCHVWSYLLHHAPQKEPYLDTRLIAEAYGGEEAAEIGARTGCVGCSVVSEDHTLLRICRMPPWGYLSPLKKLHGYYWNTLRSPLVRLRQPLGEKRKDGSLVKNPQRMGPITFEGRRAGLAFVLGVQADVNEAARRLGRPGIDILNADEVARIEELIAAETWPDGWGGDEPLATAMSDVQHHDGSIQPLLRGLFEGEPP
jgi:DNA sulfur modification protein DndC